MNEANYRPRAGLGCIGRVADAFRPEFGRDRRLGQSGAAARYHCSAAAFSAQSTSANRSWRVGCTPRSERALFCIVHTASPPRVMPIPGVAMLKGYEVHSGSRLMYAQFTAVPGACCASATFESSVNSAGRQGAGRPDIVAANSAQARTVPAVREVEVLATFRQKSSRGGALSAIIGPFRTIHWSGVHVTGEVGIALQPIAAVGRRYRGGPVLGPKPTRGVSGLGPHTGCWAASVAIRLELAWQTPGGTRLHMRLHLPPPGKRSRLASANSGSGNMDPLDLSQRCRSWISTRQGGGVGLVRQCAACTGPCREPEPTRFRE
jgi:hypothetical protein